MQRAARNEALDISLQDVVDGVEDELLVIDSEYRVRFANSVAQDKYQKGAESPISKYCYEVLYDRGRPCASPLWDCPLSKVLESGIPPTNQRC